MTTNLDNLLMNPTTCTLTAGFEGANIGTYIGFKHVNYLVERAVLEHFRASGFPVGRLYEQFGLGFDLVELDSRLRGGLFVDDRADLTVHPGVSDNGNQLTFDVAIFVEREGARKKIVSSVAKAVLRRDSDDRRLPDRTEGPESLAPFTVTEISDERPGRLIAAGSTTPLLSGASTDRDPVLDELLTGVNGYGWKFSVPYPYVHYFSRMHMSSYLRVVEEAKHRFAAARGISIGSQLRERNWIPAVTHSRITIHGEALLEEELYVTYTVEDVFKSLLYTARVNCYVARSGTLQTVATGTITHGYGVVENGSQARMVEFDDTVRSALAGETVSK